MFSESPPTAPSLTPSPTYRSLIDSLARLPLPHWHPHLPACSLTGSLAYLPAFSLVPLPTCPVPHQLPRLLACLLTGSLARLAAPSFAPSAPGPLPHSPTAPSLAPSPAPSLARQPACSLTGRLPLWPACPPACLFCHWLARPPPPPSRETNGK